MASVDVDWAGAADAQVRKGLQLVMRIRMNYYTVPVFGNFPFGSGSK